MSVDSGSIPIPVLRESHEQVLWRSIQESIHAVCQSINLADDRDTCCDLIDALALLCNVRERLRAAAAST